MAKVIAGILAALCGAIIITTGDASLLSGQPEAVRVGMALLGDQPLLYTILLALPLALLIWALLTRGRLSTGAVAAWIFYTYLAFLAFSGAVEFAGEPLYLNPYVLPLAGFVLVLMTEKRDEPVATPAPVAGGSTVPPDTAFNRDRSKGGR